MNPLELIRQATAGVGASSGANPAALERLRTAAAEVLGPETVAAALDGAADAGDLAARATARIARRETARQMNIERVLALAAGDLGGVGTEAALDRGWLARFFEGAGDAAGAAEQAVWARFLAREAAAPGSVARRTLDFVRAMDPWELEGFIGYCAFAFRFESGWRFMFDGELASRELWAYGRDLDLTRHCIDLGLLAPTVTRLNSASAAGLRIHYRDRVFELRAPERNPAAPARAEAAPGPGYRKFTVTGQQLAEAVTAKGFFGYARNLIKALNAAHGLAFELLDEIPRAS